MAPLPPQDEGRRLKKKSIAPITATSRLRNDYMRLINDPVPYIKAEPLPSNILEWHYVVTGPEHSPYSGGFYHGKVVLTLHYNYVEIQRNCKLLL
jgi:ubiquitin-conjugating enzyme E2 J2